jgi:hypothetical protein
MDLLAGITSPVSTLPVGDSMYQMHVLHAMQRSRHIYAGTVPEHVIATRRRRNRAARVSRRINRGQR